MNKTLIKITQNDGYVTNLNYYKSNKDIISGSVLLLHGMVEHQERYLDFIHFLTKEGFDVYVYNHRGHGVDKSMSQLGHIANKKGASLLISDAHTICTYIKENSRCKKLAVFGHSMGSMVLRCLLQTYDDLSCAIVSSTSMPPVAVSNFGIFLANIVCTFQGAKKRSRFLQKVMFGGKDYTSLCTRTSFDWLTRNNTIVGRYISDPYCGFLCTASFYRDIAMLAAMSARKRSMAKTRKNLPILLLSGTKDPVGGYGTHVPRLHALYSGLGFERTELKLYPEARHELINELNYEEVYNDILAFLHENLA